MFVALDPSLRAIGWARTAPSGSGPVVGVLKPRGHGVERLQDALNQVLGLVREAAPRLVLVEGYAFGRANQAHQLGELGGVIRLGLHQLRIPWTLEVPPPCVKKLATGNGNAKKELVLAEAIRRLAYQGGSFDEADARWLLEAARIHYGVPGAAELPRKHLAGLSSVEWPALEVAA